MQNYTRRSRKEITHLSIASLIFGCMLWYIWGANCHVTRSFTVPLCLYNVEKDANIESPEQLSLTLKAPRALLSAVDTKNLALHVDAHTLQPGPNPISVTHGKLFLPETIRVVHCIPSNIVIQVHASSSAPPADNTHKNSELLA